MEQTVASLQQQLAEMSARVMEQSEQMVKHQQEILRQQQEMTKQQQEMEQQKKELDQLRVDPRNIPKPPMFSGKKEDWERWKHVFVSWLSTIHARYPELLSWSARQKESIDHDSEEVTLEDMQLSQALYAVLVGYCSDQTQQLISQVPDGNGLEVWRILSKTNEPSNRTKSWVWRRHLMNPQFPGDINKWAEAFHQSENEISEFEKQFKKIEPDDKLSVLVHVAPKEIQQMIFLHSNTLDTCQKTKEYIEQYLTSRNLWRRPQGASFGMPKAKAYDDGGPAPMDIGAVKGEKGGKKGKDGKGERKWEKPWGSGQGGKGDKGGKKGEKGKSGKGKGDSSKEGKGKGGKEKGKGGNKSGTSTNPHAGKQCHVCKKYGHIASDCWWKVSDVAEEPPKNDAAQASTGGVGSIFEDPAECHDDNVLFAVSNERPNTVCGLQDGDDKDHIYLMVDSGACESVAQKGELQDAIFPVPVGKQLFSVQGSALKIYGKQYPKVKLADGTLGEIDVTVTDASESLLSVHNLVERGYMVIFSKHDSYMQSPKGVRYPLEKKGKRWYLRIQKTREVGNTARRIAAVEGATSSSSLEPGEPRADYWKTERDLLIRVHVIARKRKFTPADVDDCPVIVGDLEPGRITEARWVNRIVGDGEDFEDYWFGVKNPREPLARQWTGRTVFKLKPRGSRESESPVDMEEDEDLFEKLFDSPAVDEDERDRMTLQQLKEEDEKKKGPCG